jgi:hypothetical protein
MTTTTNERWQRATGVVDQETPVPGEYRNSIRHVSCLTRRMVGVLPALRPRVLAGVLGLWVALAARDARACGGDSVQVIGRL